MNVEELRQELQKLAELRHKLLEAYDLSQEVGPARPKRAPGERYDPETPPEQRPTPLDVLIGHTIAEGENQIWAIERLLERRGGG
jgi:hypothetical protein